MYECSICGNAYPRAIYVDGRGVKRHTSCTECRAAAEPNARLDAKAIKAKLINGCKCRRCGYSEFASALCFHHIDPSVKDAGVSALVSRYCTTPTEANYKLIIDEIMKCVILCANCHNALHAGEWSL